jgi:hypothetical protein
MNGIVGGQKLEESSIEEILQALKQRVLHNGTLNHFKKEINVLVDIVEKKDPKMERLADIVGSKLASILQKPEQEMQYMLKRISLLNKKNEKKNTLERTLSLIKAKIEATLK